MPAHESGANLPASAADTVVVLERLAVQQEKIDAATRALANATPKLQHADRDQAETARPQASKSAYSHAQVAHSKATAGVTNAQKLMEDEAGNEIAVLRDAPLPPLRRTPPEVLGVIFEFCVYQDLDPRPNFGPRSNSPKRSQPFILAGVCKSWRIAALTHPRVWAYIDLDFHSIDHNNNLARWHQYVFNLLARSGAAPLHIRCQWMQCRNMDSLFVQALLLHLHRCVTLVLSISGSQSGFHSAAPIINAYLPALRILRLYATDFLSSNLTDVKGRFPLLADAWFVWCSPRDVSFLLEAAPFIENLQLEQVSSSDITTQSSPLVYPALKSLTIRDCESDAVACLTDSIHFSALDAIAAPGGSLGGYSRTVCIEMVTRTTISLTQLFLSCGEISANTASVLQAALLRCMSLQRIQIHTRFDRDGICLQRFCDLFGRPADDGSWLCPSLEVIDISTSTFLTGAGCGVQSLCELVRNRTSAAVDDTTITATTTYAAPVMLAAVHLPNHDPLSDLVRSHVRAQLSHSLLPIFHQVNTRLLPRFR